MTSTYFKIAAAALLISAGTSVFAQNQTLRVPIESGTFRGYETPVENLVPEDSYSLPWERVMEDSILWKKRVWRDVDLYLAENYLMGFNSSIPPDKLLFNLMVKGIFMDKIPAYSGINDRFTTKLNKQELGAVLFAPGKSGNDELNPLHIEKFRIKEDWLYLKHEHKIVVRILGIAPLVRMVQADGSATDQPIFWVYYSDARNFFATQPVYPKQDINWDQFFEGRKFSSRILQVKDNTARSEMLKYKR